MKMCKTFSFLCQVRCLVIPFVAYSTHFLCSARQNTVGNNRPCNLNTAGINTVEAALDVQSASGELAARMDETPEGREK